MNPGGEQTIPVIIKGSDGSFGWFDYTWVAMVATIYLFLIVLLYIKCMKTSKCSANCGGCEGGCDGCSDCCEDEQGLLKGKNNETEGWFDSFDEMLKFKEKVKKNRKPANYERLKMFLNK